MEMLFAAASLVVRFGLILNLFTASRPDPNGGECIFAPEAARKAMSIEPL